jgi:hypothetical protein
MEIEQSVGVGSRAFRSDQGRGSAHGWISAASRINVRKLPKPSSAVGTGCENVVNPETHEQAQQEIEVLPHQRVWFCGIGFEGVGRCSGLLDRSRRPRESCLLQSDQFVVVEWRSREFVIGLTLTIGVALSRKIDELVFRPQHTSVRHREIVTFTRLQGHHRRNANFHGDGGLCSLKHHTTGPADQTQHARHTTDTIRKSKQAAHGNRRNFKFELGARTRLGQCRGQKYKSINI